MQETTLAFVERAKAGGQEGTLLPAFVAALVDVELAVRLVVVGRGLRQR
jgi:hypothetical protein